MTTAGMLSLSFALGADAFFASLTLQPDDERHGKYLVFLPALCFGLFQLLMPVAGFYMSETFCRGIKLFGAPISFVLLFTVGLNMIMDKLCDVNNGKEKNKINFFSLLSLSVATSLDALIVGTTFSFLNISVLKPSLIIGIVTFILCVIGVCLGEKLKSRNEKFFGCMAGVILIILSFKILLQYFNII